MRTYFWFSKWTKKAWLCPFNWHIDNLPKSSELWIASAQVVKTSVNATTNSLGFSGLTPTWMILLHQLKTLQDHTEINCNKTKQRNKSNSPNAWYIVKTKPRQTPQGLRCMRFCVLYRTVWSGPAKGLGYMVSRVFLPRYSTPLSPQPGRACVVSMKRNGYGMRRNSKAF